MSRNYQNSLTLPTFQGRRAETRILVARYAIYVKIALRVLLMKKFIIVPCSAWFFLNIVLSQAVYAQECSLFQLGLWSPVQLIAQDKIVCGVRFNLLQGNNAEVWGLDAGVVNVAGASRGLQAGGVNWLDGRGGKASWSIQAAGAMNYTNHISYTGAQIALGMNLNLGGEITGLQLAAVNVGNKINGIQGGFFNLLSNINGVQIGLLNLSDSHGVQLGVANVGDNMNGIQVGLINEARYSIVGIQIGLIQSRTVEYLMGSSSLRGQDKAAVKGVQLGLLANEAGHVKGLQIGLINICQYLTGAQIGLINIIYGGSGNAMPVFPIINIGWH